MLKKIALASGLLLSAASALADAQAPRIVEVPAGSFYVVYGVNVRNGNYSTTFHLVKYDGTSSTFPFERVYNSRSSQLSDYGLGWSSAMDSRITFEPSGTLVVHEHGVAAETRYVLPEGASGASRYRKSAMDASAENRFQDRRAAQIAEFVKSGQLAVDKAPPRPPLKVPEVPVGQRFLVTETFTGDGCRSSSQIYRDDEELIREFGSGCPISREAYTLEGAYIRMEKMSSTRAWLAMTRSKDDTLVEAITDEQGSVTKFKYDDKKRLVRQDWPDGAWQGFEYDDHDNMTAILYLDGKRRVMVYDADDRVISTTPRNGPDVRFEYQKDPHDPLISVTRVTVKENDEEAITVFKLHN